VTLEEIEKAIGVLLEGILPAGRIAVQNRDAKFSLPYLDFRHVPVSTEDNTLDSTGRRQLGICLVTVVADRDKMTTRANQIADQVRARFPRGLRLPVSGKGDILISRHPEAVAPFQDGPHWRQPVRITYQTEELL